MDAIESVSEKVYVTARIHVPSSREIVFVETYSSLETTLRVKIQRETSFQSSHCLDADERTRSRPRRFRNTRGVPLVDATRHPRAA